MVNFGLKRGYYKAALKKKVIVKIAHDRLAQRY